MKVLVTTEAVLTQDADGEYWGPSGADGLFFKRYRGVFDEVVVAARVRKAPPPAGHRSLREGGVGVSVLPLPGYHGVSGLAKSAVSIIRKFVLVRHEPWAIVIRAPSPIGSLLKTALAGQRRPYGVEVVGDPWDVLGPGVIAAPMRPMLRTLATLELKLLCRFASAVAYVTREHLQRRYSIGKKSVAVAVSDVFLSRGSRAEEVLTTHYSSVELLEPVLEGGRSAGGVHEDRSLRLLFVGSLEQRYKGLDVLLRAVSIVLSGKTSVQLRVVGEGAHRREMEGLAKSLNLECAVEFLGALPHSEVLSEMTAADLLVLPSRTEGLPRVILEAMAMGLPCVASAVGGVPEVVPQEALVRPNDPRALSERIVAVLSDRALYERLQRMGHLAIEEFRPETLQLRRSRFLSAVCSKTEAWLLRRTPVR